jgi:hypothetical protein
MDSRATALLAIACAACDTRDTPSTTTQSLTNVSAVTTMHNDAARTGAKLDETQLDVTHVAPHLFGKLFSRTVDGQIYGQPLWVPGVTVKGAVHDVVYVVTENDSAYAFDANDASAVAPLWQIHVGTPPTSNELSCGNISPIVGITSTPVIDLSTRTMYFVAKVKPTASSYAHQLHAVDLGSGAEKFGGPVTISGSVPGSGASSSGGVVAFDAFNHLQRPGLLLQGGNVYIGFGSHCDNDPYHGWVFSYSASTLQRRAVYNTTADGTEGSIWMSGQGLVGDGSNVYAITGNGSFAADGSQLGDSFIKLSSGLSLLDWFTPFNQADLAAQDLDLGSGGPVLLPGTGLIVGAGKESKLYVLDTGNMGHFNASDDSQIVQSFVVGDNFLFESPVWWNDTLYVAASGTPVRAFNFNGSTFDTAPVSESGVVIPWNGAALTLSANGTQAGSAVLWAASTTGAPAEDNPEPGVLRAFDATDLSHELWDSLMVSGDDLGNYQKFSSPTVANGKVYISSWSSTGTLVVYGLLGASPPPPPPPPPPPDGGSSGTLFSDNFNRSIAPDGGLGASWRVVSGAWYDDGRAVTDGRGNQATETVASCRDCSVSTSVLGFGVPEAGPFLRAPSVSSADRYDAVLLAGGTLALRRVRGGVATVLAQAPSGLAEYDLPATITLAASGTGPVGLTVALNGVQKLSASDASAQALTAAGFAGLWTGSAGVVFDDFVLTGSSGTPPPPPPSGTLYSDNFSQQFPPDGGLGSKWSLDSGAWYSDGRAISDQSNDQASELAATCRDCTAQAAVVGFGVPEVGVFVRGSDRTHYDAVLLSGGTIAIRRVIGGAATVLAQAASGLAAFDEPATVAISASGSAPVSLTASVNGVRKLTASDASAQAITSSGAGGLWTSSAGVVFDNFTLTAP